ncbi:MFS transporter [Wolinella succinogenes]|uniref:MFS transporter n=1 Tax=Wolinella succinogenes TaxID=844 RepID=UPI0024096673|nr:MFS transporter [Wolinella succinogenes]
MTHLSLLKSNPLVRNLSLIQLINYFALMFTQVALFTLMAQNGVGALGLSVAAALFWAPSILLSPLSGTLIDRFSSKKLLPFLLLVEILATLLFLAFTAKEDFGMLLALLFLRSAAGTTYYTATISLLPKILEGDSLQRANELHSMIYSVCLTLGMALGGIVVHSLGVKSAFLIDASLYLIALMILVATPLPREESPNEPILAMLQDGFFYLFSQKPLLFIMAIHAVVATTLFDAIVTLLAKNHYHQTLAIPLAIGFINAARAFSAMVGPFIFGRIISEKNLGWMLALEGVLLIFWAFLAREFYASILGVLGAGILITTLWSYTMTMLQKRIEKRYYGRVVAYNDMFFTLIAVLSSLLIGYLLELGMEERWGIALIGGFFILTGVAYTKGRGRFLGEKIGDFNFKDFR